MRFINYLNENVDELVELLKRDCQPYLKQFKRTKTLFYSGRSYNKQNPMGPYGLKKIRKDRKPKDIPEDVHNIIDSEFQKRHGVRPRSESIFTFTNPLKTEGYGKPHVVIPKDNFQSWWHPKIEDLYNELEQLFTGKINFGYLNQKNLDDYKLHAGKDLYDNLLNEFRSIIKELVNGYVNKMPLSTTKNEVMILTDECYLIEWGWFTSIYLEKLKEVFEGR